MQQNSLAWSVGFLEDIVISGGSFLSSHKDDEVDRNSAGICVCSNGAIACFPCLSFIRRTSNEGSLALMLFLYKTRTTNVNLW
jgi:hypothetical protein